MSQGRVADRSLTVTPVPKDDSETRRQLDSIASAAFPSPQNYVVELSEHTLAARIDDKVVGGVILDIVDGNDEPVGIVSWLFTSPDARGRGVGSQLLEEAIEYLQAAGCQAAVAVVQWSNTPSSKLFARREFERTSSLSLARRFGVKQVGSVWRKSYHFINVSCDLWFRSFTLPPVSNTESKQGVTANVGTPDEMEGVRSTSQSVGRFVETVFVHALLLAVVVGGVAVLTWDQTTLLLGGVGGVLIALRWLPYAVSTVLDDKRWTFWSWGNVYPFAGIIAVFGGFLPVPGHMAPEQRDWSYREALPVLGPAATTWGGMLVGGLIVLTTLQGQFSNTVWEALRITLTVFVVVDLWLILWPFDGYNGRVIYDWNRSVWAVLSAGAAVALGVVYLD